MWIPGLGWLALGTSTLFAVQKFVRPDRVDWLSRLYTRGQVAATGARWRAVVDPAVDPSRNYMFCQNHVSLIDHCTVYAATPHFKQGIELAAHFDIPFYGPFMRQRGTIPVHRDQAPKQALQDLTDHIEVEAARGHSLLVFPEGTRTTDGRVAPFRGGVIRIAHKLGMPLVPVAVTGMFEVMAKNSPYIFPGGDVTVYVEAPIETAGVPRSQLPELVERVHAAVAARIDAYYGDAPAGAHAARRSA